MSRYKEIIERFEEEAMCPHCNGDGYCYEENNPDNEWPCNACDETGLTPAYQKSLKEES